MSFQTLISPDWSSGVVGDHVCSPLLEADQHIDGVDADLLHRIAAFHDEQRRQSERGGLAADLEIVRAVELELRNRIVLEGVDPERDNDGLRAIAADAG